MKETRFENITVAPAPHISRPVWTYQVMIDVIIGLVPAMIAAGYYFRLNALILIGTCVLSCLITEWLCNIILKRPNSLNDFSAVVTGIILALSLPPGLPVWAAVIGSAFSIAIGKMEFGGLGSNIFNPAMVGRTFLTACFGMLMTTWMVPATTDPTMPKIAPENMMHAKTQATPLGWSKIAIKDKNGAKIFNEEQFTSTVIGDVGGCLGETSAIALLFGGIYLLIRRTINFYIPAAILLSAFIFAGVAYLIDSDAYMEPLFHLTSGGMLLCAFFIATDPVTAPLTRRGMLIFGAGVGTLTMLIRIVGAYPEGVMFSVLLMNAVTPLIDRLCKRVPAGGKGGV
jgi:electron transport complex protein RnfD